MLRTNRMPLTAPGATSRTQPSPYTDGEISSIVSYVETFGGTGPPVPSPDPAAGDLNSGAELYLENCAACHSTTGIGEALTSGQVAPNLRPARAPQIAEAVLVGPGCPNTSRACGPGEGAMPRFDFTQGQMDSLVRYVQYLQDPRDRGGASLGHLGPVAEGAIALVVGLGIMLAVTRWIGTRVGEG
jgi:ubiquinol-cytochrome c reductase cytochrome c subunit